MQVAAISRGPSRIERALIQSVYEQSLRLETWTQQSFSGTDDICVPESCASTHGAGTGAIKPRPFDTTWKWQDPSTGAEVSL